MGDMADYYALEEFIEYGLIPRLADMKKLPKKITKRFYVGSNKISADWPKATLVEAVAHAKRLLDQDVDLEHAIVVQIVRVVRRQPTPLIVEKV